VDQAHDIQVIDEMNGPKLQHWSQVQVF